MVVTIEADDYVGLIGFFFFASPHPPHCGAKFVTKQPKCPPRVWFVKYSGFIFPLTPPPPPPSVHGTEHYFFCSTIDVLSCCFCLLDPSEGGWGRKRYLFFSLLQETEHPEEDCWGSYHRLHLGAPSCRLG